jgi:hypothetical protein
MTGHAELVQELKALRKGRALFGSSMESRVGPNLRAVCAIMDGDGLFTMRQKIATRLTELADHLPEDLRLVTCAAFALAAEARQPLYQDRVRWAAMKQDRDPRTVRRRVDEAINQLAELARCGGGTNTRAVTSADPWHTTELRLAVALDRPQPEVLEQRRIVADQSGIRELDLAVSLPVTRRDLEVTVFYGGVLKDRGMESSDRAGFALLLPKPLSKGEPHDFTIRFRLPAFYPHMVCVPRHPCDLFDLRVRFPRDRIPQHIWTLQGAFQRDITDPTCQAAQYTPTPTGELHMRFRHLAPGLAYGARWDPRPHSNGTVFRR